MALKFRRGTTAQQSGSLAFGEPYVNTTLGTLLIGGPTGDIVLSATGTGSTGNFGPISGSGLDITGNANIAGNLTLGGQLTIGNQTSDTVNVVASLSSSLIPSVTNAFDLGSEDYFWRDLYISTGSIKFVGAAGTVVGTLSNAANGMILDSGVVANGNSSFGTSSLAITSVTGSLRVSGSVAVTNGANITGSLRVSGSVAVTNGANITGSLIVSGSNIEFTRDWPAVGSESHFLRLAPFTASNGRPYEGIGIAIEHWNDGTGTYEHSLQIHSFDNDSNPTYGAELNVSPFRTHMQAFPSGAAGAGGNVANISVQDLKNGKSQALVYGDFVQIGNVVGQSIIIGNSGSVVEISGSVRANITGSIAATNGVVSGSSQVIGILDSLNTFSGSQLTQNTALATITGSLIGSASAAKTTNDSQDISITNLNSTTASLSQRVAAVEAVSGTFARTNSTNTFNGSQTVSGSLTVTQDLIVLGSSSIQTISSSNLVIGAALVTLNTATPSVRFAGLNIIDSGSTGGSGSLLYDAVEDEFIFVHRGNGTNITSSHFILGPQTYDNLGNETYLTTNKLPKASGLEHIVDSNITDTGTLITLGSNAVVNGTFYATGTTLVSGSSQITYSGLSGIPAGIVSGSSQITAGSTTNFATDVKTQLNSNTVVSGSSQVIGILSSLNTYTGSNDTINTTQTSRLDQLSTASGSAITRLTALEVETANLESFTSSINTTIKSKLDADGVISGSSQLTTTFDARYLNTGGDNVVSGSSQITAGSTTNFATDVKTQLNSNTVVSGSSQVTLSSTTGYGTVINQNLLTTSNVQHASLGIGMAATGTAGRIDAANDIVAFSSSDIRFKENIKPIENAIDKIRKISGNTYDWKEENKVEHGYEGNDVGVIAQEIEAVLPQLVQTRESGFKAVKYDKLVALLIEGIKEQQLQIEQLRIDLNNCTNNKGL
jgi:hypothetical protein